MAKQSAKADSSAHIRTHFRTCPLCEACCGLSVTADHETRQIVSVRGDENDPFSQGYLCPKGVSLKELSNDPAVLRTPMIKRDGKFEPASWDEALDLVAQRLSEIQAAHGNDAVGAFFGNSCANHAGLLLAVDIMGRTLGTRQLYSAASLDHAPKLLATGLMFGDCANIMLPDLDRTDFFVVQGGNPLASNGSLMTAPGIKRRLEALRARGGKLVVIDPRKTETAAIADLHVAIRPGADALLLFAIVHELFAQNLVEPGRLSPLLKGLDDVRHLSVEFTPERVEQACGVPAAVIRELAGDFGRANSAVWYGRMGTCTQEFGTLSSWLTDVINVLTGNLDRPGGGMLNGGALPPVLIGDRYVNGRAPFGRWHSRVDGLPELSGLLPAATLADEILTPGEGQIRAFVTMAGNPVLSVPNGPRLAEGLAGLDFMVSFDIYINETTRHADVILPSPSWSQHADGHFHFSSWMVRKTAKAAPPIFPLEEGMLDEWEAAIGVSARMKGISEAQAHDEKILFWLRRSLTWGAHPRCSEVDFQEAKAKIYGETGPEQVYDIMIRTHSYGDAFGLDPEGLTLEKVQSQPHGVDLGPLTEELPGRLATPDGLIDLAPELITVDVPRLSAAIAGLEGDDDLRLIGRRHLRSKNTWMHNLDALVSGKDRCTLMIHPEDAARRNLQDGSRARVSTALGSIELPVELTDAMRRGVVCIPHGWGHDPEGTNIPVATRRPGVNLNRLFDETLVDAPSKTTVLNGVQVEVQPVA